MKFDIWNDCSSLLKEHEAEIKGELDSGFVWYPISAKDKKSYEPVVYWPKEKQYFVGMDF